MPQKRRSNRKYQISRNKVYFKLPLETVHTDDTEQSIEVRYADEIIMDWCLSLLMLERGLIEFITIVDEEKSHELVIRMDKDLEKYSRGRVLWSESQTIVSITPIELNTWIYFFLRYYRDNATRADHIDVELLPHSAMHNEKSLFLVLKLQTTNISSISVEEFHRRYGLE